MMVIITLLLQSQYPLILMHIFSTVFAAPYDISPPFAPVTAASSAPIIFRRDAVLSQLSKLK